MKFWFLVCFTWKVLLIPFPFLLSNKGCGAIAKWRFTHMNPYLWVDNPSSLSPNCVPVLYRCYSLFQWILHLVMLPYITQEWATAVTLRELTLRKYMQQVLEHMHVGRKWMQKDFRRSLMLIRNKKTKYIMYSTSANEISPSYGLYLR